MRSAQRTLWLELREMTTVARDSLYGVLREMLREGKEAVDRHMPIGSQSTAGIAAMLCERDHDHLSFISVPCLRGIGWLFAFFLCVCLCSKTTAANEKYRRESMCVWDRKKSM